MHHCYDHIWVMHHHCSYCGKKQDLLSLSNEMCHGTSRRHLESKISPHQTPPNIPKTSHSTIGPYTLHLNPIKKPTQQSLGSTKGHDQRLALPNDHPMTVSNHSPQMSRANHCDNSTAHPIHRDLPTRHTRLDDGERS